MTWLGKNLAKNVLMPMQHFLLSLVVLAFCNLFTTVSRVDCVAHPHLLAPWSTRLLSQCMLHWWWVNVSTARELLPCTHTSTSQDRPQDWSLPGVSFCSFNVYFAICLDQVKGLQGKTSHFSIKSLHDLMEEKIAFSESIIYLVLEYLRRTL